MDTTTHRVLTHSLSIPPGHSACTPFSKYSDRLKAACAEGAEDRRPPTPLSCRFCGDHRVFTQLCYTVANPGKWAVVVSQGNPRPICIHSPYHQCPACKRTWFPEQVGPPPAQLARIGAIRAEDRWTSLQRTLTMHLGRLYYEVCGGFAFGR